MNRTCDAYYQERAFSECGQHPQTFLAESQDKAPCMPIRRPLYVKAPAELPVPLPCALT